MDTILKKITSVGKTVEKLKPSHTVGVIVRWCRHGKQHRKKERKSTKSCPTLCDPIECTLPDSSVQARILVWTGISFSRGSSQPRNRTQVYSIAGRFFTDWATREAHIEVPQNIKPRTTIWPSYPTSGCILKNWKQDLKQTFVQPCSLSYYSQ